MEIRAAGTPGKGLDVPGFLGRVAASIIDSQTGVGGGAKLVAEFLAGGEPKPSDDLEDLAYKLVGEATGLAIEGLLAGAAVDGEAPVDARQIAMQPANALQATEVFIDRRGLRYPSTMRGLRAMAMHLGQWFSALGVPDNDVGRMVGVFPYRFAKSVEETLARRRAMFEPLERALENAASDGAESARGWERYRDSLLDLTNETLSGSSHRLGDLYMPLRAYWTEDPVSDEEKGEAHVVSLMTEVVDWVRRAGPDAPLRLLSGEPGAGKSTVMKMLAAEFAGEPEIRPILLPLHRIETKAGDDIAGKIRDGLAREIGTAIEPFEDLAEGHRVVLLIDGLDELRVVGADTAKKRADLFLEQVAELLERQWAAGRAAVALVGGRELVVRDTEEMALSEVPVLHLLPYAGAGEILSGWRVDDAATGFDDRAAWWTRFRALSGQDGQGIPDVFAGDNFTELTRQPMLSYLLATVHERDPGGLGPETTRNNLYAKIIDDVYERAWDKTTRRIKRVARVGDTLVDRQSYQKLLEEIAVTVWHGDDGFRGATMKQVKGALENADLAEHLVELRDGLKRNPHDLLISFFFKSVRGDDQVVEFTHKSFAEFLTARRLARLAKDMKPGSDRSLDVQLARWIQVTAPRLLPAEVINFLRPAIAALPENALARLEAGVVALFNRQLATGMPVHAGGADAAGFHDLTRRARNAEWALAVTLDAVARARNPAFRDVFEELDTRPYFLPRRLSVVDAPFHRPEVDWSGPEAPGYFLARMAVGRPGATDDIAISRVFGMLGIAESRKIDEPDLDNQGQDAATASGPGKWGFGFPGRMLLRHAVLPGVFLQGADLQGADLQRADLQGAHLRDADLRDAHLQGADLQRADLQGAHLQGADLQDAHLQGAHLQGADLQRADLRGAHLQDAHLQGAHLRGADLQDADLQRAHLQRADLQGAHLQDALFDEHTRLDEGGKEEWIRRGARFVE